MTDFTQFFDREYAPMVRALTLALGDQHAAEDAAQEGFSRADLAWARVSVMDRPATWVYVVALRYERRRFRRHGRSFGGTGSPTIGVDEAVAAANRAVVVQLLNGLTPRQRLVVVLRYQADLPMDQIAGALGCSVGTVKATLHQSLDRLRVLGKEFSDAGV